VAHQIPEFTYPLGGMARGRAHGEWLHLDPTTRRLYVQFGDWPDGQLVFEYQISSSERTWNWPENRKKMDPGFPCRQSVQSGRHDFLVGRFTNRPYR